MNVRWGILATGRIAHLFAESLALVDSAERYAVASRDRTKASDFATVHGFSRAYGSYQALLADTEVDAVYIATPNVCHRDNILACLEAGKHVLCEKPMTTSSADTQACADAAQARGLFLMEAMWTRFLPVLSHAQSAIAEGRIGTPRLLRASFVARRDPAQYPNLFDPAMGGGALLDLGVYPLAVGQFLLGDIATADSQIQMNASGVDELSVLNVRFCCGAIGQMASGFVADVPVAAEVFGDRGVLRVLPPLNHPSCIEIEEYGRKTETIEITPTGTGFAHEVEEVHRCLEAGLIQSPRMPLDQSVAAARIIEECLRVGRYRRSGEG